jgi:hypothetical protein
MAWKDTLRFIFKGAREERLVLDKQLFNAG